MAYEERETGSLIGSDKVEGTAVYGADSQRIGSIERVMIDKISGKVAYAVLGFGGFLGIGDDHYPLPWQSLKYETNLGGYVTGIKDSELSGLQSIVTKVAGIWADPSVARSVDDYYAGVPAP
jgi:PRC-barrel domain protein